MTPPDNPNCCSELTLSYGRQKSAIRELFEYGKAKARELGADQIFDFSIGNPSVPPPERVQAAFHHLLQHEDPLTIHSYTSAPGDPSVRAAIARQLNLEYGTAYEANHLYLTCGAAAALSSTFRALTLANQNNEMVAIAPYFPEYRCFVEGHGARLVEVPSQQPDLELPLEGIENAITSSTRAVIINSPNNPSGKLYQEPALRALGELLNRKGQVFGHPIFIVADEPYRDLVYEGRTTPFLPLIYRNTIVCYSYSKAFSMPGERIGYVLVPPELDYAPDLCDAIAGAARSLGYVCAPSLIQRVVGLCADVKPDMTVYARNRHLLFQGLTAAGYECVEPDGAFYLFVRAPGGDAKAFSDFARTRYQLLVVPSDSFGLPGYLRISYCVTTERIESSLPLFKKCLETFGDSPVART